MEAFISVSALFDCNAARISQLTVEETGIDPKLNER